MRVSDSTIYGTLIFYLQQARVRQAETQLQISSGKRITVPSDNPIDFAKAADYKTILATVGQRERNAQLASDQLNEVDSALQAVTNNVLTRAKELAVAMANPVNGATERKAAAAELKGLIGQMLEAANRKVGDRALFTGATTRGRMSGTAITPPGSATPVTITAGSNDTLAATVDGTSSGTVTLAPGPYTSGDALAAEIQSKINADGTLAANGKSVTVQFATDHLVIISNSSGASSNATIAGGTARQVLGLSGGATASGADPFSLAVATRSGAGNTGGAVISPGEITDANALTYGDYLVKFASPSSFNIYQANSAVSAVGAATNTGGGVVTKSVVNDTGKVTLDAYRIQFAATGAGGALQYTITDTTTGAAVTGGPVDYQSGADINFDGLRIAIKDGGTPVGNGDIFTVGQQAQIVSTKSYVSGSPVSFNGIRFSIGGSGATAPAAGDLFRVLTTHQYNGDATDAAIEIGDNVAMSTLLNGDRVFVGSKNGADVFTALQSLTTALLSNNVDGIQAAHASLDTAFNQIVEAQGEVGARANRLQGVQDGLSASKADTQKLLSETEDVDLAKAASDLALQQVTLQAAAQSSSYILQTSLLNYLK